MYAKMEVNGIVLNVSGTYYPGMKETRYDEAEPEEFIDITVTTETEMSEDQISEATGKSFDDLIEMANECLFAERESQKEADADNRYNDRKEREGDGHF